MFITPAFAQTGTAAGGDFITSLAPLILIVVVMYFLMIRPQQKRMKAHREMVANLRRGDLVVTSGGILGKVVKVTDEAEIDIEIAKGVVIQALRHTISEVRSKTEPVVEKSAPAKKSAGKPRTSRNSTKKDTAETGSESKDEAATNESGETDKPS